LRLDLQKAGKKSNIILAKAESTYCIFFLSSQLTRGLEVDSEISEVSFVAFARIFDSVDMERNSEPVYGEHDSLGFPVDDNLSRNER